MNQIRNSPERFKDTKHKVFSLVNTPQSLKKEAKMESQSPILRSERILVRENQIKAKEEELEGIKQQIESKRNTRIQESNQTAKIHQSEALIKTQASNSNFTRLQQKNSSPCKQVFKSPTKQVNKSPIKRSYLSSTKKDLKCEKFNTMIDEALKEITNDRSSRQTLLTKQKSYKTQQEELNEQSSKKTQELNEQKSHKNLKQEQNGQIPRKNLQQELIDGVKNENRKVVEPPKIKTGLYKPVLRTKSPQNKPQNPKKPGDPKKMTQDQSASTMQKRSRSRKSIVPAQQTPEIVSPVVERNYMQQTQSSQQRVRPSNQDKSPQRPCSAFISKTQMVVDQSPKFGEIDQQTEFQVIEKQIQHNRHKSSKVGLYNHINALTYGDIKKHDSPNSRLMRQKQETHKQKTFYQSKNIKGQHYNVGVDKGYVVSSKDKLDYDLAQDKPMEFAEKFQQQELKTSMLSKSGTGYQLTEKTSKRKIGEICEKARQVIQEARGVVV